MLTHFSGKREIWLTPFLNRLRQEMGELTEFQRKEIVGVLKDAGIVRIEKREGQPYDYSVIVIADWNHPWVRQAQP